VDCKSPLTYNARAGKGNCSISILFRRILLFDLGSTTHLLGCSFENIEVTKSVGTIVRDM